MTEAPRRAAVSSAAARSVNALEFASTSRILQFGQVAEAMSRSSEISCAQPPFARGGVVPPLWLTFVKQPVAHAGRPYVERYVARSDAAVGASYASTIAKTLPEPAVVLGRL